MEEEKLRWGTWEELLLGGAVLRHGTLAWEAVALELQARSLRPNRFTPKECEAKYEDLQERYSGCSAWFEELRKQRVAELKRDLEESEDSIGSLKTKLRRLISEREDGGSDDLDAGFNIESINDDKEKSRARSSAGSLTEESTQFWSAPDHRGDGEEAETEGRATMEAKVVDGECTRATELQTASGKSRSFEIGQACVRKRRGKRKRKARASVVKDASAGESDLLSSVAAAADGDHDPPSDRNSSEKKNLEALLESVMEEENASVFRRRSETQRRAKYKRSIRRHVDFGTLRSGIRDGAIPSTMELYRDLLLLSSNAIAFYPKSSPEYQSALSLRASPVLSRLRKEYSPAAASGHRRVPTSATGSLRTGDTTASVSGDHVPSSTKKRSRRPYNRRTKTTTGKTQNSIPTTTGKTQNSIPTTTKTIQKTVAFSGGSPPVDDRSPPPQPARKRGVGRPPGGGRDREKRERLPRGRKKQRR
ncbi:hypothetical protein H6P81_005623 [Aristolochia fimbriata]|uniref:Bromo domain-containing protein n=1 Tax=Aristolochia fimbriata TaxID=158543 RepID=A0AAV7EW53_ARIFI|nr:hypothetical protein H6P81_005623 [Aristolochia fimbriata]